MSKKILMDATHPEETRVAVVNNGRLEEFDFETSTKQTFKGNIYLAKVTRVEPSLQAAFVEYGGNRHGFLAFAEIHPDYYQIPVSDREKLEKDLAQVHTQMLESEHTEEQHETEDKDIVEISGDLLDVSVSEVSDSEESLPKEALDDMDIGQSIGETFRQHLVQKYKIQEVIKKNQILLVQIVKEERGNKGAALTTYMSLAGRYSVLMPNTANAGGISRKIRNLKDRKRLRKLLEGVEIPDSQSLIIRTAGQERNKTEIKKDYEFLSRTWDDIREKTISSNAPALIHEESDIIRRAIRDVYSKDIEEILVQGNEGYKNARQFMKTLIPSHTKKVQLFKDKDTSLFRKYQIEEQIDQLQNVEVPLSSGGSIVINQTEALVAIDINSGKSTKERHIEETAYRTNLEAASEIARQLRLRDLAGLVVIDFIDMYDSKKIANVEKRLRESVRIDRARIQVGRISQFGLLEMSRQRLRPSVFESFTQPCTHCQGKGFIRSTESLSLNILRALEENGSKKNGSILHAYVPKEVAFYLFNNKRPNINLIEETYGVQIQLFEDPLMHGDQFKILSQETARRLKQTKQPNDRDRSQEIQEGQRIDQVQHDSSNFPVQGQKDELSKSRRRRRSHRRRKPDGGNMGTTPINQPQGQPQPHVQMAEMPVRGQESSETSEGVKKAGRSKRRYNNRRRSKEAGGEGNKQSDGSTDASGQDMIPAAPPKTETGMNSPLPVSPQSTNANSEGSKKKPPRKGWWQKLLK